MSLSFVITNLTLLDHELNLEHLITHIFPDLFPVSPLNGMKSKVEGNRR